MNKDNKHLIIDTVSNFEKLRSVIFNMIKHEVPCLDERTTELLTISYLRDPKPTFSLIAAYVLDGENPEFFDNWKLITENEYAYHKKLRSYASSIQDSLINNTVDFLATHMKMMDELIDIGIINADELK